MEIPFDPVVNYVHEQRLSMSDTYRPITDYAWTQPRCPLTGENKLIIKVLPSTTILTMHM